MIGITYVYINTSCALDGNEDIFNTSLLFSWMFDTHCFQWLICICYIFMCLFSEIELVLHGRAL